MPAAFSDRNCLYDEGEYIEDHLCYRCLHAQDCWEAHDKELVLSCIEFEEWGPEPDGDAYWEYMNASLYGHEPIGHGD